MNTSSIVILVLAAFVGAAYGLECYDCTWTKGLPADFFPEQSKSECEKKPKNTVTCTPQNSIPLSQMRGGNMTALGKALSPVEGKATKYLCGKESSSAGDKKYVLRKCIVVNDVISDLHDDCESIDGTVNGEKVKIATCVCPKDKCNSAGLAKSSFIFGAVMTVVAVLFK